MEHRYSLVVLAALALAACGGGDSDDAFQTPGTGTGPPPPTGPTVSSVTLITSSPTIPSDDSAPAQLSAYVRDANNRFVEGVLVDFSSTSGGLTIAQPTTDSNGVARASLSAAGDPSSRPITVTATANGVSGTITVNVAGTRISLQGPNALIIGQQGNFTVTVNDAGNRGIPGVTVNLTSQRNNTLSAASVTTDSTGRASFTMTATTGGNDTITASGAGITVTQQVAVNSDSFAFTSPAAGTEVPLGAPGSTVTIRWLQNNVPVVGQPVSFSTTRGSLNTSTVNTDANGQASATVQSGNAGSAVVTATAAGGNTTQLALEFVAMNPAAIDVQPSSFTIGANETSTITAVVRDAANNLVKNQTVVFTLEDVSGGSLSVGSAVTDSQGRAQTVYTSGSSTSANNGVRITGTVQGTAISDTVELTVARRELFISIGTGNTIEEINQDTQYRVNFAVQITDASGNGVAGVPVSLSILSERYHKGLRVAGQNAWSTQINATCVDEDTLIPATSRNGVLDPGEDENGSGRIEAGNIATVTASATTTDTDGFVLASVVYPQEYAFYLDVVLEARTSVQGTEFVRASRFTLPGAASDFNSLQKAPPGPISPFGQAGSCSDPN